MLSSLSTLSECTMGQKGQSAEYIYHTQGEREGEEKERESFSDRYKTGQTK